MTESNTLPAKIEEYTPLQAQSTFTTAEKAAFKELHEYISEHTKNSIWWYWDLGQKVSRIYKAAKAKKEVYGKKVLFRLAVGLGHKTDRQLRNAMEVNVTFGTKKAFTQYVNLRGEAKNRLTWSHIVYLSGVGDTDMRLQLAAASLEQSWTAADLYAKVRELCERVPRGSNTPKTKIPTSARGCLTHVQSQAEKFVFNYDNAWSGDNFNLTECVSDIPADKLSEKLLEGVRDAKSQVVAMQARALAMADILSRTETTIALRMQAQEALEAEQAAELHEAASEDAEAADDDDAAIVPLNEERNRKAREKRAKAKKKKAGPKHAGRVGVNR